MLSFATALLAILGSPGPGVLSLAGVGSAFGYRAAWAYGTGLFVGSNLVMLAAATGLAALLLARQDIRLIFMILSSGYLLYLASRVALAGSKIGFIEATHPPGFWGAIVLQVFNPKAYAVGVFTFSNYPFWPESLIVEIALKFVILNAIWIPIHIIWMWAGVSLGQLNLAPRIQRTINLVMAAALIAVVLVALFVAFQTTS
jgi:threonine/homoserine/homoserine lactone efflux protein